MKIPLVDLQTQSQQLREDMLPAIEEVMRKSNYILGEEVEFFEEEFADFCEAHYCVGVSSGTEALHMALRALDIGPGDEVITAANTFVASALAIAYVGATPVAVDIDPLDYNLDVELVEEAITPQTKAIMPVHLYGQPAEMTRLRELTERYGLKLVEDASQAHGARYRGQRVGTFGDAGCFSFYPGKNLGGFGDGGAVVTKDAALAQKLRELRNYGQANKNVHSRLGFNARLDTIQAAVLRVKLPYLETWNQQRAAVAKAYDDLLQELGLTLPRKKQHCSHIYHLYVVQHPQRNELLDHLRQHDVHGGIHYPSPIHQALSFLKVRTFPDGVPIAQDVANKILSLPIYPELSPEGIEQVVDAVNAFQSVAVDAR